MIGFNPMIVPATEEHARQMAELHFKYTKSLLSDLGRRMCYVFYETALKSKNNFGCVYIVDSKVLGFNFGTRDNSRPFKSPKILCELAFSLLKKPWLIKRFLFHVRKKIPPAPEELYSALDIQCRGKGIGNKLYFALHEEFRKRGLKYYEGRVDKDNIPVLMIFRKLGADVVEEFVENGISRLRLQIKFDE